MAISYIKLWKLLIDKKMNKTQLCELTKMSSAAMAKMTKDKPVDIRIIERNQQRFDFSNNR